MRSRTPTTATGVTSATTARAIMTRRQVMVLTYNHRPSPNDDRRSTRYGKLGTLVAAPTPSAGQYLITRRRRCNPKRPNRSQQQLQLPDRSQVLRAATHAPVRRFGICQPGEASSETLICRLFSPASAEGGLAGGSQSQSDPSATKCCGSHMPIEIVLDTKFSGRAWGCGMFAVAHLVRDVAAAAVANAAGSQRQAARLLCVADALRHSMGIVRFKVLDAGEGNANGRPADGHH